MGASLASPVARVHPSTLVMAAIFLLHLRLLHKSCSLCVHVACTRVVTVPLHSTAPAASATQWALDSTIWKANCLKIHHKILHRSLLLDRYCSWRIWHADERGGESGGARVRGCRPPWRAVDPLIKWPKNNAGALTNWHRATTVGRRAHIQLPARSLLGLVRRRRRQRRRRSRPDTADRRPPSRTFIAVNLPRPSTVGR